MSWRARSSYNLHFSFVPFGAGVIGERSCTLYIPLILIDNKNPAAYLETLEKMLGINYNIIIISDNPEAGNFNTKDCNFNRIV